MHRIQYAVYCAVALSVVMLASCGVRDTSEDGINSIGGASSVDGVNGVQGTSGALGSDTTAIAGFWEPDFSGSRTIYVFISDTGDWTYIREDLEDNCYNIATYPVTYKQGTEYEINEDGFIYSFNAEKTTSGNLRIEIISEEESISIYESVTAIAPQDIQVCG